MRRYSLRASARVVAVVALVAGAGCDRASTGDSHADASTFVLPDAGAPLPPFKPSKSTRIAESGRKLPAKLVRRAGGRAAFAVTNETGQAVSRVREWHYHYDAQGCIERGRASCDIEIPAGATRECEVDLGDPRELTRPAKTIEGEFYEAETKAGDVVWENDNLVPSCDERPPGGVPMGELASATGERVLGQYSGVSRSRSLFYAKNVGEGTTDAVWVAVYYYDKAGKLLRLYETFPRKISLAPGAVGELDVGFDRIELPVGSETIELTIWRVRYADGKEWQNLNLKSRSRPMGG